MENLRVAEEVKEMNVSIGERTIVCKVSNKRKRNEMMESEPNECDGKPVATAKEFGRETFLKNKSARWETFIKGMKEMTAESFKEIMPLSKFRSHHDNKNTEDRMANSQAGISPEELVPGLTFRFYGKNYHLWANQLDNFLKELNVAHVLYEPCPSTILGPETSSQATAQSKAPKRWQMDDSICHHMILNHLSDALYDRYMKKEKATSAKELWEYLESIFQTKRPLVQKYIEFQILEEKSVVEQVEEFNSLCLSIVASGMLFDATFHVSVIVSKLPPSWKDVYIKLIHEEYLPLPILMGRLRFEEEFRIKGKQGMTYNLFLSLTKVPSKNTREELRELQTDGKVSWESLKKSNPAVKEYVKNFVKDSVVEFELSKQTEGGMSNSLDGLAPQENVPVDTVRFGGKNYPVWAHQMEFMLKESRVAYVLYEPCGAAASTEENAESKAAEVKWVKDDSVCLRMILYHLSDDLFYRYTKEEKPTTARQLWEDLKLTFGTKRQLVKEYIEYQMLEENPVLEQVQGFNSIYNSLIGSGLSICEKFHVSAIVSKLPASWKDVRIKLMQEEYLPIAILMDCLKAEEESRKKGNQGLHHSVSCFLVV